MTYILLCGFPPFFSDSSLKDSTDFLSSHPFWYFFNSDTDELRKEIRQGQLTFPAPFWDGISEDARHFVSALLRVDEACRLTAAQALQHTWMTRVLDTPASSAHIVLDPLRVASPNVEEQLPEVITWRVRDLRRLLEQRISERPNLADLRGNGIYQSPLSPPPPKTKE